MWRKYHFSDRKLKIIYLSIQTCIRSSTSAKGYIESFVSGTEGLAKWLSKAHKQRIRYPGRQIYTLVNLIILSRSP